MYPPVLAISMTITKSKADDAADEGSKGTNLTTSNLTRPPGPLRALYEENKISFELYRHAVKHQMDCSIERLLAKRSQDASTACNKVLKLNSKFKPRPSCNPAVLK